MTDQIGNFLLARTFSRVETFGLIAVIALMDRHSFWWIFAMVPLGMASEWWQKRTAS